MSEKREKLVYSKECQTLTHGKNTIPWYGEDIDALKRYIVSILGLNPDSLVMV